MIRELRERGFCVVPHAVDADSLTEIRGLLDHALAALPHVRSDGWGVAISPLLTHFPKMARHFDVPAVCDLLAEALEGDVRLVHTAARITNVGNEQRLSWHFHEYDGDDGRWDPTRTSAKSRFTRFIASVYVDGSDPEVGLLRVLPRRLGESTAPPSLDRDGIWPGQVDVIMAPGSILIHDVALYHCALRGTSARSRRIFGGVYQRWGDELDSVEDSVPNSAELEHEIAHRPLVRRLLFRR